MFCPACRVEYRPGFNRCSDCDVELVDCLPEEQESADGELRTIWKGDDQAVCVPLCKRLLAEGIRYEVAETPGERGVRMRVDWSYRIGVLPTDFQKAKEIVVEEGEGPSDGETDDSAASELPANDEVSMPQNVETSWSAGRWHPDDATVEVWSGDRNWSNTIAMSLRENRIGYRLERDAKQSEKFYVLPEDELRAREIVSEIEEGRPPS